MNYRPLYMDISIVTVANINRDFCNPFFLYKHNVIGQEDMSTINDKDMRVGDDIVSFRTKSIDLYCDSQRMQIRSEDVTLSTKLSDITMNVLRLSQTTPKAIGINANYRFSIDEISLLKFCHKCSPMDAFIPMANNALMLDLSFLDWNHGPDSGEPNAVYNIKRLPDITKEQKVIQISVNNHLDIIKGMEGAGRYLAESVSRHGLFFTKCKEFISSIL